MRRMALTTAAGSGLPKKKPCPVSQPSFISCFSTSLFSIPSAVACRPRAWLKLKIGAAQVDDAPYREDLGREAEDDDKDDDPIELMILVLGW